MLFKEHSYLCKWKVCFSRGLIVSLTEWRKPQTPQTLLGMSGQWQHITLWARRNYIPYPELSNKDYFIDFRKLSELNDTNNTLLVCNSPQKYRFRSGVQYLLSWRMHWHLTNSPEVAYNLHKSRSGFLPSHLFKGRMRCTDSFIHRYWWLDKYMQPSPLVIDKRLFLQVKIMRPWNTGILPFLSYKQVSEQWQGILFSFCFLFLIENIATILSLLKKKKNI